MALWTTHTHAGDDFLDACQGKYGGREVDLVDYYRRSSFGTVRRYLDAGGDVERCHSSHFKAEHISALQQACIHGRLEMIQLLLDHGANPNRRLRKTTALMTACATTHPQGIDAARLLLSRGADPNLASLDGETALVSAVSGSYRRDKHVAVLKLLLDAGADASGTFSHRAVLRACQSGSVEELKLLLDNGASPNRVPPTTAPLFQACVDGREECVKLLLRHGADPSVEGPARIHDSDDDEDSNGDELRSFEASSLYVACFHQAPEVSEWATRTSIIIARLLLGSGARVDSLTHRHLCLRAPMQSRVISYFPRVTELCPSNAKPLQRLFLKHYTILVRLHVIGTPSTRRGPDQWLLEARHHAPLIASFLSPAPSRSALAFWAREGEDAQLFRR